MRGYIRIVDPVRNPYAPGAGQPPELAGRDRELSQFDVTLERVAAGAGALDGALRSSRCRQDRAAQRAARPGREARLGHRQDRGPAGAVAAAAPGAGGARRGARGGHRHRDPERVDAVAGVLKSFALRTPLPDRKGCAGSRPSTCPR